MFFSCADQRRRLKAKAFMAAFVMLAGSYAGVGVAEAQQREAANGQGLRQACAADYQSLCAGVQPGGGRIVACLSQNGARLSTGCRAALQSARAARGGS